MRNTVLIILLISTIFNANAEIRYELVELGTLPGYEVSNVQAINNNGQAIGYVMETTNWSTTAVLFDTSGSGANIDIGTANDADSYAYGINNSGQIVGQGRSGETQGPYATVFDPNGSGNNIYLYQRSAAMSVNNNGIAAGIVIDSVSGLETTAIFDISQPGTCQILGQLPSCDSALPYCINDSNQVVGTSFINNQFFESKATLFDTSGDGNHIDLGTLGGPYGAALYINNLGQIVGLADIQNDGPWHAAIFNYNGQGDNLDLGTVDGYANSVAACINNRGQIVGQANNEYDDTCAVFFDPTSGGNNINLNDVIDPALGWDLFSATCINDNGWICGIGWKSGNIATQAYLLIPIPVPGDCDIDFDIDFLDFANMANWWQQQQCGDCGKADADGDSDVDIDDLRMLCNNWLKNK